MSPIFRIAIPSIISNITVPLLALADTLIAGHLGAASYIGAIAVGGLLFNMVYWLFGFLRMSTGAFAAQAHGGRDLHEAHCTLLRSLCVALAIALLLLLLHPLWAEAAFTLIGAEPAVESLARIYFALLVWGAPAVLALYSLNGWFLGMQNARAPMVVALVQNTVNVVASLTFVIAFGMKVEGVALGSLLAQYVALALALAIYLRHYRHKLPAVAWREWMQRAAFVRFFRINFQIFLRTLCLIAVTTGFTSLGAAQGELTLAANSLLMQFFMLFSYFIDGFAYAGEALGGQCLGAGNRHGFVQLTRRLFAYGLGLALLFTFVYVAGGPSLLRLFTDQQRVVETALAYLPYTFAIPLCGFAAFLFDGLYIGTTQTASMLGSMAAATVMFFTVQCLLPTGNGTLWTAFLLYLACRALMQAVLFRKLLAKFPNNSK